MSTIATDGLGREHQDHEHERRADGDEGLEQRLALGALALQVLRRELQLQACGSGRRPIDTRGGLRPDLVAGGLDGLHQLVAAGDARINADRGLLGGEVDRRLLDARRLLEEALDAVHARGAGHALDGQDDLDGLRGLREGRHTRGEYSAPSRPGLPHEPQDSVNGAWRTGVVPSHAGPPMALEFGRPARRVADMAGLATLGVSDARCTSPARHRLAGLAVRLPRPRRRDRDIPGGRRPGRRRSRGGSRDRGGDARGRDVRRRHRPPGPGPRLPVGRARPHRLPGPRASRRGGACGRAGQPSSG